MVLCAVRGDRKRDRHVGIRRRCPEPNSIGNDGRRIEQAESDQAAVKLARSERPDLIIADILMAA